jgi:hypothetical protein
MRTLITLCFVFGAATLSAREFHVAVTGKDANAGTKAEPLKTISAAANVAQSGDIITVHASTYRERIDPPRGGMSHRNRITYQAAQCEKVIVTGSEPARGWQKVDGDTWKLTLSDCYFGNFNP